MNTDTTNNEVARLRGLLKDHSTFLRENGFAYRAEELMREYATAPEEPVIQDSRITELQKAISQAINSLSAEKGSGTPDFILAEFLTDCLMAWNKATRKRNDWYSPEEPANPTCANTTHKFSHCDCKEPAPDHFVGVNKMIHEWRDLGEDEEIHTGDQVQAKHHDRIHGVWIDVFPYEVGLMPIGLEAFRYRTRRPLPKQERPLEDELKRIEWHQNYSEATIYHALADAIRYLRDEIEQLKKNQK
jgi:hypothetical protein